MPGHATNFPPPLEKLATHPDRYRKLKCKPDPNHTAMLAALSKCEYLCINSEGERVNGATERSHIGVISFDNTFPVIDSLAPQLIYVRPFYSDLLAAIRSSTFGEAVLIGNPGTSKSFFQLYYLAHILNPDKFGALPPDHKKSTAPPKIVIRQVGTHEMIIYDIEHLRAEVCYDEIFIKVLDCFDPATSIYMMEPGGSHDGTSEARDMPSLLTAPPNERRYKYKQAVRSGAANLLYMPTYELDELLAIGAYLLKNNFVPDDLQPLYTATSIMERYANYGGILRHVLPLSRDALIKIEQDQMCALASRDCRELIHYPDFEDYYINHCLLQCKVYPEEKDPFSIGNHSLDFISDNVVAKLKDNLKKVSFRDKVKTLKINDRGINYKHMEKIQCQFYEDVIAELLCGGVKWKRRIVQWRNLAKNEQPKKKKKKTKKSEKVLSSDWEEFEEKMDEIHEGEYPNFDEMRPNVLYKPTNSLPLCDFFYKSADNRLVMIKLTRQVSPRINASLSALKQFLFEVGIDVNDAADTIRLVCVPRQRNANDAYLEVDDCQSTSDVMVMPPIYEVWAIPDSYKPQFPRADECDSDYE